ncbi:MAG: small ribosomal subunit Rsm22 family protein [Myxococcota bacterium]
MKVPPFPDVWVAESARVADRLFGRPAKPLSGLVREMSEIYTRRREGISAATSPDVLQARLRFFFPRDFMKVVYPLAELHAQALLPKGRTWRILDLGAGIGTSTLGAAHFAAEMDVAERFEVDAYDLISDALKAFAELAPRAALPISLRRHAGDVQKRAMGERYDLILLGLVLNELRPEDALALVRSLRANLAPGGVLLILEPALRTTTRRLMELRSELLSEWSVLGPCLHQKVCPMLARAKDWCHEERAFTLPDELASVAKDAGLRWETSTFAYLALGTAPPSPPTHRLRVVSGRLKTKGKLELVGCGREGELTRWMRLDRHESEENAAFGDARRGDLLSFEPARAGRVQASDRVKRWGLETSRRD